MRFLASLVVAFGAWTASSVPAGAATVTSAQYGFSFALPTGWTRIPLGSNDIGAMIGAATKSDPSLANVLDQQAVAASKKGLKVFAVGPVSGGFFPNLNVGVTTSSGAPTGSAFVTLMSAEVKITLTEAGASQVKAAADHFPLGDTVAVSYRLQLKLASQALPVYGLQLYTEHGTHLYVVTFSASSIARYQSVAHLVEGTWRWHASS